MRRVRAWIGVAVVLASAAPQGRAHDGPEDVIQRLSERIRQHGPSARLLAARGFEQSTLRNWDAAIADFRTALEIDSGHHVATAGCIDALLEKGELEQAGELARLALEQPVQEAERASLHAALARVHGRQQDWNGALENWRLALRSRQPEVDWFLGEAEAFGRLGNPSGMVGSLARAMERNPSIVLKRAWIHALVEAGDLEAASREIEMGLAQSRWKSTWLLLRARIHGLRQHQAGQRADAAAALADIEIRLNPERPDPLLVMEAAQARRLLGANP